MQECRKEEDARSEGGRGAGVTEFIVTSYPALTVLSDSQSVSSSFAGCAKASFLVHVHTPQITAPADRASKLSSERVSVLVVVVAETPGSMGC